MKHLIFLLVLNLGLFGFAFGQKTKVALDEKDKLAERLINRLLDSLQIADFDQSARAVAQLTHRSSLNNEGDNLNSDLLRFSFKKAHDNAKFYAMPVKITRVLATQITGVGHPDYGTYEAGQERKYWIAKKTDINGMPAPINVFFPKDGGEPKINYMGSL